MAHGIYLTAQADYNEHLKDILSGSLQPHIWWSAMQASLFGVKSKLPPSAICDNSICQNSDSKACLLVSLFEEKEFSDVLVLPSSGFLKPKLASLAYLSLKKTLSLMNDLDLCGCCESLSFFTNSFNKRWHLL